MKKVVLSALAATIVTSAVYAESMTLFSDPKTGQVFTTAGEGRVEMGDFVSAKDVDMQMRDTESKFSEYQDKQSKYVNIKSKAKMIEFSGTHYFGLTSSQPEFKNSTTAASTGFELRRNYIQAKAYFNDKDYFRVTMDTTKEIGDTTTTFANMYVKYAYLYLDKVLPYTDVEIGMAHRPWIDYEEHNSWFYRSIDKVALEDKATGNDYGPDLVNSADMGVNFKTKTDVFSSEIGIFNGEGYHADKGAKNQQNSQNLSLEWRLTGHILGDGMKVSKVDRLKDTYLNVSTYGLVSQDHKDDNATIGTNAAVDPLQYNRAYAGLHVVYNQPEFLIAAQYYTGKDTYMGNTADVSYHGFSANAEYRPLENWTVIGRYDAHRKDKDTAGVISIKEDVKRVEAGLAYKMNKNISFIGSGKHIDDKTDSDSTADSISIAKIHSKNVYMLTTEVNW